MALICENGVKECCGCGDCSRFGEDETRLRCDRCDKELDGEDGYSDAVYATLCLDCLKLLHRL